MPLLPAPRQQMDPADDSVIVQYSDDLIRQAWTRAQGDFDRADRNYNLYLGNHWTAQYIPDNNFSALYVFNRIKTILLSHAAIQNGTTPKVSLLPRQSGRKGLCFVNTAVLASIWRDLLTNPESRKLLTSIPPECIAEPPAVPQPLPQAVYAQLQSAIEEGQLLTSEALQNRQPKPKVLPPELIVEINDTTACAALQDLFDAKWDECNADFHVLTDSLYNAICGWSHIFYRWDEQAERHLLHNCEVRQVFLDPTRPDISLSSTALFEYCLSEEQGLAEFPEFAQAIDQNFTIGKPTRAGTYYALANIYETLTFTVKMGVLRFLYVRNQPYPMSEAQALQRGLVVQGFPFKGANNGPVGGSVGGDTGDGFSGNAPQEDANDVQGGTVDRPSGLDSIPSNSRKASIDVDEVGSATSTGEPSAATGGRDDLAAQSGGGEAPGGVTDAGTANSATGVGPVAAGAGAGPVAPQPLPTAYILVKGDPVHNVPPGGQVQPWGPGWPLRRGIREIVIIAGTRVADREYQGCEIPLTHNVNFPYLHGPLGQGTPQDLELLNMAVNKVITDLVSHQDQESFPVNIIDEELQKKNPDIGKETFRRPGTTLTAPGTTMRELKTLMQTLPPTPASADVWRFLEKLLDLLDKQGDMASILQGMTNAGMSGKLFQDANAAAASSILFRAKRGETMLKHLARNMLDGINRMSVEAMVEAMPKYPAYIWSAFKAWMQNGLTYDLKAEISAGGGAAQAQRIGQLLAAASQGVGVSQQTLMEGLKLDPDKERQQVIEWNATTQAAQQEAPAAAPAAAPQPV